MVNVVMSGLAKEHWKIRMTFIFKHRFKATITFVSLDQKTLTAEEPPLI